MNSNQLKRVGFWGMTTVSQFTIFSNLNYNITTIYKTLCGQDALLWGDIALESYRQ